MNAVLKPVLFGLGPQRLRAEPLQRGSSRFWPRNSPQAARERLKGAVRQGELASQAISDAGYNGVVVEVAGEGPIRNIKITVIAA